MNSFINNIVYAGLGKENYDIIENRIDESNCRNLLRYSIVGVFIFATFTILSSLIESMSANRPYYAFVFFFSAVVVALVKVVGKKAPKLITILCYIYTAVYMGLSITIAFSPVGIEQRTTVFLIFIFAISLLFNLRIVFMDALLLLSEVIYLILCFTLQAGTDVMLPNIVNSITFCILGLLVGGFMVRVKVRGLYLIYENKKLDELDRLT